MRLTILSQHYNVHSLVQTLGILLLMPAARNEKQKHFILRTISKCSKDDKYRNYDGWLLGLLKENVVIEVGKTPLIIAQQMNKPSDEKPQVFCNKGISERNSNENSNLRDNARWLGAHDLENGFMHVEFLKGLSLKLKNLRRIE